MIKNIRTILIICISLMICGCVCKEPLQITPIQTTNDMTGINQENNANTGIDLAIIELPEATQQNTDSIAEMTENYLTINCKKSDVFNERYTGTNYDPRSCAAVPHRLLVTHTGFLAVEDKCENRVIVNQHSVYGNETFSVTVETDETDSDWFVVDITNNEIILLRKDSSNILRIQIIDVAGNLKDEYVLTGLAAEDFDLIAHQPDLFRFDLLTSGFLYFGEPGAIKYLAKDIEPIYFDSYPVQGNGLYTPITIYGWDYSIYQTYYFSIARVQDILLERKGPVIYHLVHKDQVLNSTTALFYREETIEKEIRFLGVDKLAFAYFTSIVDQDVYLTQFDLNSDTSITYRLMIDSAKWMDISEMKWILSPEGSVFLFDEYNLANIYACTPELP